MHARGRPNTPKLGNGGHRRIKRSTIERPLRTHPSRGRPHSHMSVLQKSGQPPALTLVHPLSVRERGIEGRSSRPKSDFARKWERAKSGGENQEFDVLPDEFVEAAGNPCSPDAAPDHLSILGELEGTKIQQGKSNVEFKNAFSLTSVSRALQQKHNGYDDAQRVLLSELASRFCPLHLRAKSHFGLECRMIHPDAAATGGAGACAYHHCPACAENMRPEALARTANFAPVLVAEVVTSNNDTVPLVVGATCSPMPRSAAHNQHHDTAALQCRRLRRCQNPGCNVPLSCVHAGMTYELKCIDPMIL